METERGHMSVRRGVSWSPGGVRKSFQGGQDLVAPATKSIASWDERDYTEVKEQPAMASSTNQMSRKTNLTRSASLSEKELKEARVRSQIIAAQLTVPSNSNSRGVQLFNRRKQRVNSFTLESGGGGGAGQGAAENEKQVVPPKNNLTWAERAREGRDRELNLKNSATTPAWSPTRLAFRGSDIMEEPGEPILEVEDVVDSDIQERHFLPVNEKEEVEREEVKMKEEVLGGSEGEVKEEVPPESTHDPAVQCEPGLGGVGVNGAHTEQNPPGDLPNGCQISQAPGVVSVSLSRQPASIINRTARPFFSPTMSPEARSPTMDIPPAPSYSTPPLPRPVTFSPPPPAPSYPTPPLPAFTCQPPQSFSSPPPMSPVLSPVPSPVCQYAPPSAPPVSQYVPPRPSVTQYAPPTAPRPSTFVPKPSGEWKPQVQIKTGILEEGAVRRGTRKSMFTFKEKPVVAPNPELLSLVQGADERKKQGPRALLEPASEEELLALGAEASNFLAKEEVKARAAAEPEWSSTLRSSRTRTRVEHKLEQTLSNASGKGAELFAKRQSRMEKYVLEKQNDAGQARSPSPTMSLPPSWVYPSNMPGRVKAIANNSNISEQLSRTLKAQQPVQRKPSVKAPAPPPKPESPPLENGCTKIEMDLSRHQPYQLNSSLFIFNPIKDPMSTLPRGAPPPKPVVTSYSRQTSLPTSPPSHFASQPSFRPAHCLSPQLPLSPVGGMGPGDYSPHYGGAPFSRQQPRITSPVSAFSPERVASPRSGAKAPRPTFSAKKAGIEPQARNESPATPMPTQTPTPTRTPQFTRRFSSPDGPSGGTWSPSLQTSQLPSSTSSRPLYTSTASSPVCPPWETRCQSPMVPHTNQPASRPPNPATITSPVSSARDNRCLSPNVSSLDSKANHRILAKNIINAAKRKNSPSPGALSGHSIPISPLGGNHHHQACEHSKPPFSPFQSRALGAQSPSYTSPPPTPTQLIRSPVRLYNTRSLTDSDASVESEDSGLRSPGLRSYNTCPRGWGGSLRVKRSSVSTDL